MQLLTITVPSGYTIVAGKKQLRAVLRGAGADVATTSRAMIRSGGRGLASLPGQPPNSRTGALARSIKVRPWKNGEGVSIRDVAFYALFLERGAKGGGGDTHNKANILPAGGKRSRNRMKASAVSKKRVLLPRPFMEVALADVVANGLADRVRAAVISGLKFRRG